MMMRYFFYNVIGKHDPETKKLSLLWDSNRGDGFPQYQIGQILHIMGLYYEVVSLQEELGGDEVFYRVLIHQISDNSNRIVLDSEASSREPYNGN